MNRGVAPELGEGQGWQSGVREKFRRAAGPNQTTKQYLKVAEGIMPDKAFFCNGYLTLGQSGPGALLRPGAGGGNSVGRLLLDGCRPRLA